MKAECKIVCTSTLVSGLLHRLLRIQDYTMLATHPTVGKSWEGMVVETLLRGFENAGIDVEPFHCYSGCQSLSEL